MTMPDVTADLEAAAQRVKDLSDQVAAQAKENGLAWLEGYEKVLKNLLDMEEQAAKGTGVEWATTLATTARELRPRDLGGFLLRYDQAAQELTSAIPAPARCDRPRVRQRACWRDATRYRRRSAMISGKTTVIAHLGYPTFAFKAPMIYNPWFEKNGIDAVVVPMGVKPEEYREFFPLLFKMSNIRGALVTMPHKVVDHRAGRRIDADRPGGRRGQRGAWSARTVPAGRPVRRRRLRPRCGAQGLRC